MLRDRQPPTPHTPQHRTTDDSTVNPRTPTYRPQTAPTVGASGDAGSYSVTLARSTPKPVWSPLWRWTSFPATCTVSPVRNAPVYALR